MEKVLEIIKLHDRTAMVRWLAKYFNCTCVKVLVMDTVQEGSKIVMETSPVQPGGDNHYLCNLSIDALERLIAPTQRLRVNSMAYGSQK